MILTKSKYYFHSELHKAQIMEVLSHNTETSFNANKKYTGKINDQKAELSPNHGDSEYRKTLSPQVLINMNSNNTDTQVEIIFKLKGIQALLFWGGILNLTIFSLVIYFNNGLGPIGKNQFWIPLIILVIVTIAAPLTLMSKKDRVINNLITILKLKK